jgi:origin recognition complex subunit 6
VSSLSERELDEEVAEFIEPLRTAGAADTDDYKELVMSLIVGLYFLVLARRRTPRTTTTAAAAATTATTTGSPRTMDPPKMDKKTFTEMRQTALSSLGLLPIEKRHGEDVDAWIALIMNHQWAKGQEWFENIPLAGEGDDDGDADGGDLDGDDDYDDDRAMQQKRRKTKLLLREAGDADKEGLLLPGLGTMMQARVDYLSEDRREDFREWKMDILARIKQIERPGKT